MVDKAVKKMSNKIWQAYLSPTPKNIKKWLIAIKGILGTAAGAEYFAGNSKAAFWILISGAAIDGILNLISE